MARDKCTRELIEAAVELKRGGMNNRDTAACLGIHEATFYRWISNPAKPIHREFSEALKKAEVEYKAALRERIFRASEGDWKAAAWLLERMYPDEYGRRERHEIEAEVGGRMEYSDGDLNDPVLQFFTEGILRRKYGEDREREASPGALEGAEELLDMLYCSN